MKEKEKILKVMKEAKKPLKTSEIATLAKIDKDLVAKLIKELKKEDLIYSPKNCYYEPKL